MRYAFVTPAGNVHWHQQSLSDGPPPKNIVIGGLVARRFFQAESAGYNPGNGWPMECYASGVNAADAGKLRDELARKGVPTEVTRDGDPIYTDAAHRRRALKARGLFDRQAFY